MDKRKVHVISFGLGGHSFEMVNSHLSGYDRPEGFERSLTSGEYAEGYDLEGAPVIDKRAVLEERPGLSFRSPLCDARLAGAEVSACPDMTGSVMAGAMMAEPSNAFGSLLALQGAHKVTSNEPGPLDSISPAAYVAWWRDKGARIGRIEDVRIVWE